MAIKNKQFRELLNRSDFVKTCGMMSLNIDDGSYYLNVMYDYNNDVFVEFDVDSRDKETPIDKQLEIAREFFTNRIND